MSDYLCLRITETELDPNSVIAWTVLTSTAQVVESGFALLSQLQSVLAERDSEASYSRTIVIVPASAALITEVELPAKQRRHIKQVLPYVVEEQIIDPVESMHLVTPVLLEGDSIPVVAIARHRLASWLDLFSDVDIAPDHLFLDAACLPQADGRWQLMLDYHSALFKADKYVSTSVDRSMIQSVLQFALSQHGNLEQEILDGDQSDVDALNQGADQPAISVNLIVASQSDKAKQGQIYHQSTQLQLSGAAASEVSLDEFANNVVEKPIPAVERGDEAISDASDASEKSSVEFPDIDEQLDSIDRFIRSENINTERAHYSETASEILAVSAVQNLEIGLNLLQGDFRPANANAQNRRIIRNVSVAMAACLAIFLFVSLGGGYYLNWQADRHFDKSVSIYRDLFPKQRRVIDPVKQMKRQLSGQAVGATTSEFLPLLDAASRSLSTLEQESSVAASIKQLRYDVQRGNIAIDINANNIDELEAYKDLLVTEGLSVDILSANQDGDIVKGRLQIGRS